MKSPIIHPVVPSILLLFSASIACGLFRPARTGSSAPVASPTPPPTATQTRRPSPTPRPTRTPDRAATRQVEEWQSEAQTYFEAGYLPTADGVVIKFADFREESAQLGWYQRWYLDQNRVGDHFYMSAHFKWSSAYRSADLSGCGFFFAEQRNSHHYAVFLDRSRVLFAQTEYYYSFMGPARGTGHVSFGNPFDQPVEADFTLIVKGPYAYVLVDGELAGEYTLSPTKMVRGPIGVAILSGTNKDFGTRCEITDLYLWVPKQ